MHKAKSAKHVRILGNDHMRCMTEYVRECWENKSHSNVAFHCKSDSESPQLPQKCLFANKAVLATGSKKLQLMLSDTGDEDVDIIVPDSDFDSIRLLLQYIYTGEVLIVSNLKNELESLITDWEIGFTSSDNVKTNSHWESAQQNHTIVNNYLSSSLSTIIVPNKIRKKKNGGKKKQKTSDPIVKEKDSFLNTEHPLANVRTSYMELRSSTVNRDCSSLIKKCKNSFDDSSETNDQKEDRADFLLSIAFLKEERNVNKKLTTTREKLMEAIKRHKLYVNRFIGPQKFSALKLSTIRNYKLENDPICCPTCGKQVGRRYMKYHILTTHGNERPFLCEQCGATFALYFGLQRHIKRRHHPKKLEESSEHTIYTCKVCNKALKTKVTLQIHMTVHSDEKLYSCPYCDKRFRQHTTLSRHKKIHTGSKPFSCKDCVLHFSTSSSYNRHLKSKVHADQNRSEKTCSFEPFTCGTCGISFSDESRFLIHETQHRTEESEFPCRKCPEIFSSLNLLKDHVTDQHQDGIFKCQHCPNYYSSKTRLEEHLLIHTDSKREPAAAFLCNHCEKSFQTKTRVDAHIKSVHMTGRPFKCRFCPKDYKEKKSLLEHERIHTGERPYVCPHCPRTFRTDRVFKIHVRTHTGEKPFVCGQCNKSFRSRETLRTHTKTHTGNKIHCTTCGQVFCSKSKLEAHEQTHSGDIDDEEEKENTSNDE